MANSLIIQPDLTMIRGRPVPAKAAPAAGASRSASAADLATGLPPTRRCQFTCDEYMDTYD